MSLYVSFSGHYDIAIAGGGYSNIDRSFLVTVGKFLRSLKRFGQLSQHGHWSLDWWYDPELFHRFDSILSSTWTEWWWSFETPRKGRGSINTKCWRYEHLFLQIRSGSGSSQHGLLPTTPPHKSITDILNSRKVRIHILSTFRLQ